MYGTLRRAAASNGWLPCFRQTFPLWSNACFLLILALVYLSEREVALRVFLEQPGVQMDTNHPERALRVIPLGGPGR